MSALVPATADAADDAGSDVVVVALAGSDAIAGKVGVGMDTGSTTTTELPACTTVAAVAEGLGIGITPA